jgi:hypothetical protein
VEVEGQFFRAYKLCVEGNLELDEVLLCLKLDERKFQKNSAEWGLWLKDDQGAVGA